MSSGPFCSRTTIDLLAALGVGERAASELRRRVAAMGSPDPAMGEYLVGERLSLGAASRDPLRRTPREQLPDEGERASYFLQSVITDDGRYYQIQRRFAPHRELARCIGGMLDEPAVRVREIVLPEEFDPAVRRPWIEAASVVPAAG